jgi:putative transposase
MQVFTLPKRLARVSGSEIALLSPGAQQRARKLEGFESLMQRGVSAQEAAQVLGVSKAALYRWRQRLRRDGPWGLELRSRRPRRLRTPKWSAELACRVQALRVQYPMWGKAKLAVLLRREGIAVSESTVGRILTQLRHRGVIQTAPQLRDKLKRSRATKRFHAKRLPRGLKPTCPGEIVQVDTLHLQLLPGVKFKQFTAQCPVSRWTVCQVYPTASSARAADFLHHLLTQFPFPVRALQVDGGSEFKKLFEALCLELGLTLYVLPPRSPKLNGAVERANGTWRYEFFATHQMPLSLDELPKLSKAFQHTYNFTRPHQALHLLTPHQYLLHNHPHLLLQSHMY